jgi:hypothetical protein
VGSEVYRDLGVTNVMEGVITFFPTGGPVGARSGALMLQSSSETCQMGSNVGFRSPSFCLYL